MNGVNLSNDFMQKTTIKLINRVCLRKHLKPFSIYVLFSMKACYYMEPKETSTNDVYL